MNIAVFGATGGTGQEVVRQALAQEHNVTAFIRDPHRLPTEDRRLRVVVGDGFDPHCVSQAVARQDAVVVALGSHGSKDVNVRAEGTANVIRAMEASSVRRLVVLSAGGVGDSYKEIPFIVKILSKTLLKSLYVDHEKQERYVRKSKLDWVTVRPAMLANGPATGRFENGNKNSNLPKNEVTRADVASFLLKLTNNNSVQQALSIP